MYHAISLSMLLLVTVSLFPVLKTTSPATTAFLTLEASLYNKRFDILTVCNFHFIPKQASKGQAPGRASKTIGLLTLF